jgi:hypothetical protein
LKLDLKRWNEEVFGNIGRNKRIHLEDLWVFEMHEESMALDEELMRKARGGSRIREVYSYGGSE